MIINQFLIFFISFTLSWALLKIFIPLLSKVIIDLPGKRSAHIKPCPSGGGIFFILIQIFFLIFSLFMGYKDDFLYVTLISLPLAIIGFIDDEKDLKNNTKFLFQLGTSIFLVITSKFFSNDPGFILSIIGFLTLTLIAISFINFINFMDGIDGLVGGCMLVVCFTILIVNNQSLLIISLIGGLLGFLYWNWHPAKVFMGDTGSTFLGAFFIGIIFQSKSLNQAVGILLVISPLLVDAITCILRRFMKGQNIFRPHNLHLYQRLYQAGIKQDKVALIYISSTLAISLSYLFLGIYYAVISSLVIITTGYFLDRNVAIKFL